MWRCNNCGAVNPDSDDLQNVWANDGVCHYCGASRFAVLKRGGCLKTIVVVFFLLMILYLLFSS
jgi:hypothetical protein